MYGYAGLSAEPIGYTLIVIALTVGSVIRRLRTAVASGPAQSATYVTPNIRLTSSRVPSSVSVNHGLGAILDVPTSKYSA